MTIKKLDTCIIMGSHPGTRNDFDWTRTDCDIWVFNEVLSRPEPWCKRADAVWQMHDPAIWRNPLNRNDPKHYEWLKTQTQYPVIMQQDYTPEVPMSIAYPKDDIFKTLLDKFPPYSTSSVAYSIAYAIYLGYKKIEMYGVEMETNTEYFYQRTAIAFWLALAIGRGIEVEAHCTIFNDPLYGFDGDINLPREAYISAIKMHLKMRETEQTVFNSLSLAFNNRIKALVDNREGMDALKASISQLLESISKLGQIDGALSECNRYLAKADAMIKESNKFLIVRQEYEGAVKANQKKYEELSQVANMGMLSAMQILETVTTTGNVKKRSERVQRFVDALNVNIKSGQGAGHCFGAMEFNRRCIQELDAKIRAAGGSKSYEALTGEKING